MLYLRSRRSSAVSLGSFCVFGELFSVAVFCFSAIRNDGSRDLSLFLLSLFFYFFFFSFFFFFFLPLLCFERDYPDHHSESPEKQKTATELTQKLTEAYKAARTPTAEIEHQPPSAENTEGRGEDTEPGAGVGAHAIRTSTVAPFWTAEILSERQNMTGPSGSVLLTSRTFASREDSFGAPET